MIIVVVNELDECRSPVLSKAFEGFGCLQGWEDCSCLRFLEACGTRTNLSYHPCQCQPPPEAGGLIPSTLCAAHYKKLPVSNSYNFSEFLMSWFGFSNFRCFPSDLGLQEAWCWKWNKCTILSSSGVINPSLSTSNFWKAAWQRRFHFAVSCSSNWWTCKVAATNSWKSTNPSVLLSICLNTTDRCQNFQDPLITVE